MDSYQQALALHQQGQLAAAKPLYQAILAENPNHADSLHLLGLLEFQQKNYLEAQRLVDAAIAVNDQVPVFHFNRALILLELQRLADAEQSLRNVLNLNSQHLNALAALGDVLAMQNRYVESAECFSQAQQMAPDDSVLYLKQASALMAQQGYTAAEKVLDQALRLRPEFPEALANLGVVYLRQGRLDEAEQCLKHALQLNPSHAEALNNLGATLLDQGRHEEAKTALQAALQIRPDYSSALNNLGHILMSQRLIQEAADAFSQAIAITPDFADAHWNLSLAHLTLGDFVQGWAGYEWRIKRPESSWLYPDFSQPEWHGEQLNGKRILLYAEQGMGDTLQFVRFVPMVKALGGSVILRCQPPLKRLLSAMPDVEAVSAMDEPLPSFDVHCPLLSLPYRLGITQENMIPTGAYLQVEPDLKHVWESKLRESDNLRVGLVWAGAPRPHEPASNLVDRRRSTTLKMFEPLLELSGIDFYSLQKGGPAQQVVPYRDKVIDLMDEVSDFAETAALVSHLDLVITVDTSVAHLAGGLGKPTWVLSRFDGCWRWMLDRDDSPWYPEMRLFRQQHTGDWVSVIEQVAQSLQESLITRKF